MGRKGKGTPKGILLPVIIAMPILTLLLSMAGAKLILSEVVPQEGAQIMVCVIVGIVSLLLSVYTAMRAPQKKLIWGLGTAGIYCAILLLSNLLFFAEGYGNPLSVLCAALGAGLLGSFAGAGKRRKFA